MAKKRGIKIKKGYFKVPAITLQGVRTLNEAEVFLFRQIIDKPLPDRPPVINMIKAEMCRKGFNKEDYEKMEQRYNMDANRIRGTVSSGKNEPIVIKKLCEYLEIGQNANDVYNVIANYDFELKEEARIGMNGGKKQKKKFLEAFDESWSQKTIDKYLEKMEEYRGPSDDDFYEHMEEENKKRLFLKLLRIYEQYPYDIEAFCDYYREEDEAENES